METSEKLKFDAELASSVFNLLVEIGGADDNCRQNFIRYFSGGEKYSSGSYEYRFQGHFGFGGKLRFNGERLYADYYLEDQSPQRDEILSKLNTRLERLLRPS